MAELEASVKKTAAWLGKVIKKPPMKPKLLQKPPFRFLFDVVMEITKTTGLLQGLYTPEELDSERVKEKPGKITFLSKAIKATALTCGVELQAKPSKIVAGQEPENTNAWLQALAKCAIKKMDSTAAVQQVLSGTDAKPAPAEAAPAEHQPEAEAPPPPRPDDQARRGKRPAKSGAKRGGRRPENAESEEMEGGREREAVQEDQAAHTEEAEPRQAAPEEFERPPPMQRPVSRGRRPSEDGTSGRQDRPASARRGQRRRDPAGDGEFPPPAVNAVAEEAPAPEEPAAPETLDLQEERVANSAGKSRRPRPATTRRMKPAGVEETSPDEPVEVTGLMAENDEDDDDADAFEVVEAAEQSAPRRTPIEGEDDGVQGSLMRSIQQKKGAESAAEVNESSVSEVAKLKQRAAMTEEVDRLREAIQALCRSANPLGKIVDYIQEDCDSMQTEVAQWNEEHRNNLTKISSESATTETELQQARLKLEEINRQISDQQEMIRAMKSSTFENDARIQRLLGGISFSAAV